MNRQQKIAALKAAFTGDREAAKRMMRDNTSFVIYNASTMHDNITCEGVTYTAEQWAVKKKELSKRFNLLQLLEVDASTPRDALNEILKQDKYGNMDI